MKRLVLLTTLCLGACEPSGQINPPTEPARPLRGPAAAAPIAQPAPGSSDRLMRGAGAASFIGRWASVADWCAHPQDDRVPIDISITELRGYETRCAIVSIDERGEGYDAVLDCEAEGRRERRRVRFEATDETLRLIRLDRPGEDPTSFIRCTTLAG